MKKIKLFMLFISQLYMSQLAQCQNLSKPEIVETLEIDTVWAANHVSFDIETVGENQYIAYYNKDRFMTIASRNLNSKIWERKILDNKLKWDSHNYVELGIDNKGFIHISGNMHNDSLVYYRSNKPNDIQSIVPIHKMIGKDEISVTYPNFFNDKDGELFFSYRTGSSGKGTVMVNKFLNTDSNWIRYIDKPLFDGFENNNDRSAYYQNTKDKNGVFHFTWMWRSTPLVESCHQLCYAKSIDLIHWQNAAGQEIELPIKPDVKGLIIDDVPEKGGLHNGKYKLLFTQNQKVIIAYLKYDDKGFTQLYLTKFENNKWIIKKMTNWNFRWKFIGGGDEMTRGATFNFDGFSKEGYMSISWENQNNESGQFIIDPESFEIITKDVIIKKELPSNIYDRITNKKELKVNLREDKKNNSNKEKYYIKWESMSKSHGTSAPKNIPTGPLSKLLLIKAKSN